MVRFEVQAVTPVHHNGRATIEHGILESLEVPLSGQRQQFLFVVVLGRVSAHMRVEVLVGFADKTGVAGQLSGRMTFPTAGKAPHKIDDFLDG
jgi:hypothetical protein